MTLREHLSTGTTTVCYLWRIDRVDGVTIGFTDHDADLTLDSVTYYASPGVTTTKIRQALGLSPDDLEVDGVIDGDLLTEDDLRTGRYDGADVTLMLANWQDTSENETLVTGKFGDVTQTEGGGFTVGFMSQSYALNQPVGITYQRTCNRKLGDSGCKVDLTDPAYRATATVTDINGTILTVSGISSYGDEWFTLGTVTNASGRTFGVRESTETTLALWDYADVAIEVGDTLTVTAGCKLDADTCRTKFNNIINFLGFNFIPGNDALTSYPIRDSKNYNGGSLFK